MCKREAISVRPCGENRAIFANFGGGGTNSAGFHMSIGGGGAFRHDPGVDGASMRKSILSRKDIAHFNNLCLYP